MALISSENNSTDSRHLALFVSFSGTGGVERVTLNLLQGLSQVKYLRVDLLLVVSHRGVRPVIPWPNIRVIDLGVHHSQMAIPALIRYLRNERPDVLMVAKDRAIRAAIVAHALAGVKTRLVGQLHMNMQGFLKRRSWLSRWLRIAPMRILFPKLTKIICVSNGVVQDTLEITGMSPEKVLALKNPVITPEIAEMAAEDIDHPWLKGDYKVILAVGRLSPEKDFETLLRAFARIKSIENLRLILLGEGPLRDDLEKLQNVLEIGDRVAFLGYQKNPYAWMRRASVLALSSRWEGAPTVLIEAMSLGLSCVSTDCDFGPNEILQGGRVGRLVPVGDDSAFAEALRQSLLNPLASEELIKAVEGYRIGISARAYVQCLFD